MKHDSCNQGDWGNRQDREEVYNYLYDGRRGEVPTCIQQKGRRYGNSSGSCEMMLEDFGNSLSACYRQTFKDAEIDDWRRLAMKTVKFKGG